MKLYISIFIGLFLSVSAYSQTTVNVTEVLMPQYVQANGTSNTTKVPFVCRVTLSGLTPDATYRYYNSFTNDPNVSASNTGTGAFIKVNPSGSFTRIASPTLASPSACGELKADASGSYTGWFMAETVNGSIFTRGGNLYFRIMLNNGAGGGTVARKGVGTTAMKIISFGATATDGTAIRSTPAASGVAKNFVMLWDNTAGTGQPIVGAVIEGDGVANTTTNGYAPFYAGRVNETDRAWGTIIPNTLVNGIQKIVQYSLADGSRVGSKSSASALWAKEGGGTVSTINSPGTDTLVLDGTAVPVGPPVGQTITFNGPLTKTYGDATFDPGATTTSGLPVLYSSNNTAVADTVRINGTLMVAIKGAGTAAITASQAGDDDFMSATNVTQTLTVDKKALLIKPYKQYWVKGTAMPDLTLIYTGFVNGDDSSDLNPPPVVITTATPSSPVGDYDILVSGAGSSNYNISYDKDTLTVVSNTQPQTITFNTLPDKIYGEADYNPGATTTSPLTVTYASSNLAVATIVNNKVHIVGAGSTTITASQAGDLTYDAAVDVSQSLKVNKAPLTITADNQTRLFGQDNPAFTISYSGFVNGEDKSNLLTQASATTAADKSTAAGTYPITITGATSDNYDITHVNGILTINALPSQTITFTALAAKKYGDADFKPGAKASSGLPVTYTSSNTSVATIVTDSIIHIVGAGTATITAKQGGNTTVGAARDVTQTLTVNKATLTIRANDQKKNEGQVNPAFTMVYSGFVNGDDSTKLTTLPTVTTTATASSLAGTYRITPQGAASSNYNFIYQYGTLTVLPVQGEGQDNLYAYVSAPGQLTINVYAVGSVKVAVQLFDLNGSRMANTSVTLTKGFNLYRIPVGHLSPGIYNVRIAGADIMLKTKIVIQ